MLEKRLVEILKLLIEKDTTNPPGNEAGLVAIIQTLLPGASFQIIEHSENRSSLVVNIGKVDSNRSTFSFIGHMDTVPFTQSNWTYPAIKATVLDGKVFGRGSSDMKGGLAVMVKLGQTLLEEPKLASANLRLIFTADEEAGGLGIKELLAQGLVSESEYLIVPEPTSLQVALEQKGAYWVKLEIFGRASHGSMPEIGSNSIDTLFKFKEQLANLITVDNALVGPTTVSLNKISGGNKTNVVADYAVGEIDIRYPKEVTLEVINAALETCSELVRQQGDEVKFEVMNYRPAIANSGGRLVGIIKDAYQKLNYRYNEIGVRYYTDLSSFSSLKNEFVIVGPGIADKAHVEDEYVEINSLVNTYKLYELLLTREWSHE